MRIKKRYILLTIFVVGVVVYFFRRVKKETLVNPYTGSARSEDDASKEDAVKKLAAQTEGPTPYTGSGTPAASKTTPDPPPYDPITADPYTGSAPLKGSEPVPVYKFSPSIEKPKSLSKIGSLLQSTNLNAVDASKLGTPNLALPDMKKSVNTYIPGKDVV